MSSSSGKLWRFSRPQWMNNTTTRTAGVYTAGGIFSLGLFFFIDAATYSHSAKNGSNVHIKFVDWIPGICSALGMLVINSIEKSRLSADSFTYSGTSVAWKARLVLFLGFALMAGGLAGSVVCIYHIELLRNIILRGANWTVADIYVMVKTVLVLKYVLPDYSFPTLYFGVANVIANSLIMLSSVVLWISQNMEEDYTYNLAL